MMQAVKRFDPDRGFRLATYAMWWIRAAIQEYILHSWSLVKMGTTAAQKKLFFNLRRLKGQMQAIDDGDLQPEQVAKIARMLDVPEQDVVSMNRRLAAPDHSLNATGPPGQRGRMAGLAGRRDRKPGNHLRRSRGAHRPQGAAVQRAEDAERARAPHPDRAPAEGQSDHARGAVAAIRHLARAGAADRGPRLREAAEGDEGADRRTPAAVPVGRGRASGHRQAIGNCGTLTKPELTLRRWSSGRKVEMRGAFRRRPAPTIPTLPSGGRARHAAGPPVTG